MGERITTVTRPERASLRGGATVVARRELREQWRSRANRVSTLLAALAVVAVVVLPALLAGGRTTYRVAVVGQPSALVRAAIQEAGTDVGAKVTLDQVADAGAAAEALNATGSAHVNLALILGPEPRVELARTPPAGATSTSVLLAEDVARLVGQSTSASRLGLSDQAVRELLAPRSLAVVGLRPAPVSAAHRAAAVTGSILLFLLLSRGCVALLSSVVQEKSSRVIEVLLATVGPRPLLAGKLVGYGVTVLIQGVILAAASLISAAAVGSNVLQGSGAAQIGVEIIWVVLGFFFYATLFVAAGSLAARPEDATAVSFPFQIPMLVGYVSAFSALGSGAISPIIKVLAYLPPTAAFDMPAVVAAGGAGAWQEVAAMVLTAGAGLLALRLGAVVFERSILRTGSRQHFLKVLREDHPRHRAPAPAV
jgi:ABC-2 type transport system permease protein